MCLKFGTPKRLADVYLDGACYPMECESKALLLRYLKQELRDKAYDDTTRFHPFLKIILKWLVRNHRKLCRIWREPNYPFCDILQAIGLVFGFMNGLDKAPERKLQDALLLHRFEVINRQVFSIVRNVVLTCVPRRIYKPWQDVLDRWRSFSGMEGFMLELALQKPRLLQITFRRQVALGVAA
jgi:hypothetical protein